MKTSALHTHDGIETHSVATQFSCDTQAIAQTHAFSLTRALYNSSEKNNSYEIAETHRSDRQPAVAVGIEIDEETAHICAMHECSDTVVNVQRTCIRTTTASRIEESQVEFHRWKKENSFNFEMENLRAASLVAKYTHHTIAGAICSYNMNVMQIRVTRIKAAYTCKHTHTCTIDHHTNSHHLLNFRHISISRSTKK